MNIHMHTHTHAHTHTHTHTRTHTHTHFTCRMVNPQLFISSIISSAYSTASGLIIASVLSTVTAGGSGKIGLSSIACTFALRALLSNRHVLLLIDIVMKCYVNNCVTSLCIPQINTYIIHLSTSSLMLYRWPLARTTPVFFLPSHP